MYEDCTSWCVYSWNRIHLEEYGWKWSSEENCWAPANTRIDCFWDFGNNVPSPQYLALKEAREVTCTRAPTTSPTGCYPTDYEWNQYRSDELCEDQDQGVTDKSYATAEACNS